MKLKVQRPGRISYGLVALAIATASLVPALLSTKAHAFPTGGQLQSRAIRMSSSKPYVAGDADLTYLVTFKPASDYTAKGFIVDFCSNDPIIGNSTCTAPAAFTVGTPTINASPSAAGFTDLGGSWTASALNSGRTLKFEDTVGVALDDANTYAFTLTTARNPSTTGSFYARIITYTSETGDIDSYAAGTEGSTQAKDYGGIALSTAAIINITAKVMETLSFCVYNAACGDDPSITIGHAVGSATVIDNSAVDTATANWSLSTNAQSGAAIRLKGNTLISGSNDIDAAGAAAVAFAAGTEKFGTRVSTSGTNITATAPYNGAANNYGLDTSTAGENITTTYGDHLAALSAPTNNSVSTLTYGATAALTTPAGTYTAAHQLIATGTF